MSTDYCSPYYAASLNSSLSAEDQAVDGSVSHTYILTIDEPCHGLKKYWSRKRNVSSDKYNTM